MQSNFAITGLCLLCRAAPLRDRKQPDSERPLPARHGDGIAHFYLHTEFFDAIAVEPDMPFTDQRLGKAARFGEAQMPEQLVYPQRRASQA